LLNQKKIDGVTLWTHKTI